MKLQEKSPRATFIDARSARVKESVPATRAYDP